MTFKIVLRKKANKDGEYPVCLRITKNRQSKYIQTSIRLNEMFWKNGEVTRKHPKHLLFNKSLSNLKLKVQELLFELEALDTDFTLEQFEARFKGISSKNRLVSQTWDDKINELMSTDRIGNAQAYKDTKSSFFKFIKNDNVKFEDVTPETLMNYEVFLRKNGNNNGGIAVKMREFRALYNYAIKRGIVDRKHYPFETYKISKLKNETPKRALKREQVEAIENLDLKFHPTLLQTHRLFIFSYYTGGMNFKDMMLLTWDNIKQDRISYKRAKTKQLFNIPIFEPVKRVLDFYRAQESSTNYVFPILLQEELSPTQIQDRKKKTLRTFNKKLNELAKLAEVKEKVTSYVIRHSFATNLKFEGVPTDVISELMGHSNVQVTQAYLKQFSYEELDKAWGKLVKEPELRYYAA